MTSYCTTTILSTRKDQKMYTRDDLKNMFILGVLVGALIAYVIVILIINF